MPNGSAECLVLSAEGGELIDHLGCPFCAFRAKTSGGRNGHIARAHDELGKGKLDTHEARRIEWATNITRLKTTRVISNG